MKRALAIAALFVVALVVTASTAAPPNQQATISQLRAKIQDLQSDKADLKSDKSDLRDQINAQNYVIGDQDDTIQRLRTRIANWPDPIDVITARGPDGLWSAMLSIWRVFPTLDEGAICGYDHSSASTDVGLSLTTYTFERTTGC